MQKVIITKVLPKDTVEAINSLHLTRIMKERCYKLVAILIRKGIHDGRDFSKYQRLSTKYIEKVFGKRFNNQFFNHLKRSNIIDCNRKCVQWKGVPYGYRVNQDHLKSDWTTVQYQDSVYEDKTNRRISNPSKEIASNSYVSKYQIQKNCKVLPTSPSPTNTIQSTLTTFHIPSNISVLHINTYLFQNAIVTDDLSSLHYDMGKIMACAEKKILSITKANLNINDEVNVNSFKVYNQLQGWSYHTSKEKAIAWAKNNGCELIQDDNNFYLAHAEQYVQKRKESYRAYVKWLSTHLQQKYFYASRNLTNNRLDHNLTSASDAIMQVIKEDNELIEIDLRNSQFAIHALWLKADGLDSQHEDIAEYCEICSKGILYETLAQKLNVTREDAKSVMMSLSFSAVKNNTKEKALFKSVFPNVVKHIDGFKKEKKKAEAFAIDLQQWESEIFIDNLYLRLKQAGLFCLTKHDSLLIRSKNKDLALSIMTDFFEEIGFKCALNIK